MPEPLQAAIAANETIVIDVDPDGQKHQRLVKGRELYFLDSACADSGCLGNASWQFKRARDFGEL